MRDHDQVPISSRAERIAEIFDEALTREGVARETFLDSACAGDLALRAEIVSMLSAHARAAGFLESRKVNREEEAISFPHASVSHRLGEKIGRYQLLEVIGEGGFGTVYRAKQLEPVQREVALKIIKLGMDTRQVIGRFEVERQALALMDHPGIAKVFDAGATDAGRPYFVMELVQGAPITDYCDAHQLDTTQRLRLFMAVCQAVQHAHQKGIIHRDLKPLNVLVNEQDGRPAPKVIDFGIARATDADQVRTHFTDARQVMGTPTYMSPEQAAAGLADIDTRSDIYSLGVLLYELLTGTTPFDAKKLMGTGFDEMMRIIREEEPARPSTRLTMLGETAHTVADRRQTDTHKLKSLLRGDLDWITMKCLEKEPARRYASAGSLADDVQRHLENELVVARPPSVRYRVGKFARRHRGAVAATASILLVLIASTAISVVFALRAADQRRIADREAAEAKAAQSLAEQRALETKRVAEFQSKMLTGMDADALGRGIITQQRETLKAALERQQVGEWPNRRQRTPSEIEGEVSKLEAATQAIPAADVARRVLDEFLLGQASKAAQESLSAQPLVEAQIHDSLADAYRALGLGTQAERQCRTALALRTQVAGAESGEVAVTLAALAWILIDQGQYLEAESTSRKALSIQRRLHGPKHVDVATVLFSLGVALRRQGKYDQAEPLYHEALSIRRELLGNEHLDVADTLNSLALLYQSKNDYEAAEANFRESLALRRKLLGDRDPIVAGSLNNLANLMAMQGNRSEAKNLLLEALEIRRSLLGAEHPDVAQGFYNLGVFLNDGNEPAEAESFLREADAIWRKTLPEGHTQIAYGALALGLVLKGQNKFDEAESLIRESVAIFGKASGGDDSRIADGLNALAGLHADRGDFDEAEAQFREIISRYETRFGPGHQTLARVGLADTLIKRAAASSDSSILVDQHLDEAETLLLAAYDSYAKPTGAPKPIIVRRCLESLVELYNLRSALEPDKRHDVLAAEWQRRLEKFAKDPSQVPK